MSSFRILLSVLFTAILLYTICVVVNHGWTLFSVFFSDLAGMNWAGQFNLDFSTYLTLSSLWVAWRHHFSPSGIAIGLVALIAGMLFFAPYLLYHTYDVKGDIKALLLGKKRA